jgi:hypothetical protein
VGWRWRYASVLTVWTMLVTPPVGSAESPDAGLAAQPATSEATARDELLERAMARAASGEQSDHAALLSDLQSRTFLTSLDSEQDYAKASRIRLRVERVARALARNPAPSARAAFLELLRSKVFLADEERRLALVRAGETLRPAPRELIAFWERHSRPHDIYTATTIPTLVANGSGPALRLFERKLADPAHRQDEKVAWLHTGVLVHRNDGELLRACERMLRGSLPMVLRPILVESLFDYRPGEWFRPASSYSPPPLRDASSDSLALLAKLGERALHGVPLSTTQRAAVARRLEEVQRLQQKGTAP